MSPYQEQQGKGMPLGFGGYVTGSGLTVGDSVGVGVPLGFGLTVGNAGRMVTSAQFQNCSGAPGGLEPLKY